MTMNDVSGEDENMSTVCSLISCYRVLQDLIYEVISSQKCNIGMTLNGYETTDI
jgi:hypothetical protein